MLACLLSDSRKMGRSACSFQDADDMDFCTELIPSGTRRSLEIDVQRAGARRDRTAQFMRIRTTFCPRLAGHEREVEDDMVCSACQELSRICEEASQMHTSLAVKLAQHNGLRQFGADFANRVPPLELRMMLPDLEKQIEQQLHALKALAGRLEQVQLSTCRIRQLHDNLAEYLSKTHAASQATFNEQCQHLRELSVASPLFSPILSPVLGKRLAAVMCPISPCSTTASSPNLGAASSPGTQARSSPLELPGYACLLDEMSEGEQENSTDSCSTNKPFSSVFAIEMVISETKAD